MSLHLSASCEAETEAVGRTIARHLKRGDLILLRGDLGVGKTVLARALIRAVAGAPIDVPSPTFALVEPYDLTLPLHHVDLYRLEGPEPIRELGLDDALETGVTIVEWPDRAPDHWRGERLEVEIKQGEGDERMITITPWGEDWTGRLQVMGAEGLVG